MVLQITYESRRREPWNEGKPEGTKPSPEEVLVMAEKYKTPSLCSHYCAKDHYAGKSCNGSFVSDHYDKKRAQASAGPGERKIPGLTTEYSYFRIKTGQEKSCPVALYAMDGLPFYRMKFITP